MIGNVIGDLYPPSNFAVLINNLATALWLGGSVLLFFSSSILKALQVPESTISYIDSNKMMLFMGLFFINNLASNMMKSGAFEIYLNDELVYSKLETGRMPQVQQLLNILDKKGLN